LFDRNIFTSEQLLYCTFLVGPPLQFFPVRVRNYKKTYYNRWIIENSGLCGDDKNDHSRLFTGSLNLRSGTFFAFRKTFRLDSHPIVHGCLGRKLMQAATTDSSDCVAHENHGKGLTTSSKGRLTA
ncbi:MAG: hypothetical protein CR984_04835, partial [Proteobacteria bacterium]